MSGTLSLVVALQLVQTCAGKVAPEHDRSDRCCGASAPGGVAYLITNTVNGKKYVGVTKRPPNKRWQAHRRAIAVDATRPLYRAMHKHGIASFAFEVIASALTPSSLCELERILVAQHGSFWQLGRGYNLTLGGDGQLGREHTAQTRAKMSATRTGKAFSQAHRAAMAAGKIGKKSSAQTRARISEAKAGRPMSPNTRAALAQANTGRRKTTEEIEKLRKSKEFQRRPILTPAGRFESVMAAACAHEISECGASYRAARGIFGWKFEA